MTQIPLHISPGFLAEFGQPLLPLSVWLRKAKYYLSPLTSPHTWPRLWAHGSRLFHLVDFKDQVSHRELR